MAVLLKPQIHLNHAAFRDTYTRHTLHRDGVAAATKPSSLISARISPPIGGFFAALKNEQRLHAPTKSIHGQHLLDNR